MLMSGSRPGTGHWADLLPGPEGVLGGVLKFGGIFFVPGPLYKLRLRPVVCQAQRLRQHE